MDADSLDAPVKRLTWGDALKREMAKRDLTPRKVADFCKVNEKTVKAWIDNEEIPTHGQGAMVTHMMRNMRFIPLPPQKGKEPELLPKELMPAPIAKGATGPLVTFGEALRQEREAEGLSQKDLAELMGVSQFAPANWEIGRGMHKTNYEALLSVFPRLATHKAPALTTKGAASFKAPRKEEPKAAAWVVPVAVETEEGERALRVYAALHGGPVILETVFENMKFRSMLAKLDQRGGGVKEKYDSGLTDHYHDSIVALLAQLERKKTEHISKLEEEANASVQRLQAAIASLKGVV